MTTHLRFRRASLLWLVPSLLAGCAVAPAVVPATPAERPTPAHVEPSTSSVATSDTSVDTVAPSGHDVVHTTDTTGPAWQVPSRGGVRLRPTSTGALSGRVVVVDPGHNGRYVAAIDTRLVNAGNGGRKACNTSGTATAADWPEHAFTWDLAVRLTARLRSQGATVLLTRPNDRGVGPCVDERAAIGNRGKADLVVSLHADGNTSARARGFHIITSNSMTGGSAVEASSLAFALTVRDAFKVGTRMPYSTYTGGGRAITVRHDIAGLNLSNAPGIMLEAGNMRQTQDAAMLGDPAWRQSAADALDAAVRAWLSR